MCVEENNENHLHINMCIIKNYICFPSHKSVIKFWVGSQVKSFLLKWDPSLHILNFKCKQNIDYRNF